MKTNRNAQLARSLTLAVAALATLSLTACGADGDDYTVRDADDATLQDGTLVDGMQDGTLHGAPGATQTLALTTSFEHADGFNLDEREVQTVEVNALIDDTDLDVVFHLVCRGSNVLELRSSVSVCSLGPVSLPVGDIDTAASANAACVWKQSLQTGLGAEPTAILLRRDDETDAVAAILEAPEVSMVTLTFAGEAE